jgi:cytochrome d ubiquinol oxidase subunit I
VFGLLTTVNGVSPTVSKGEVITSLTTLTLLYGALAVIEVKLMLTYIRRGADPAPDRDPDADVGGDDDRPMAFAY